MTSADRVASWTKRFHIEENIIDRNIDKLCKGITVRNRQNLQ
jgi:hypothetical protein